MNLDNIISGLVCTNDTIIIQQAKTRERVCIITNQDLNYADITLYPHIDVYKTGFNPDYIRGKRYNNIYILSDINHTNEYVEKVITGFMAVIKNYNINQLIINTNRSGF
jgi:hypothetical protein